jgi:hypothetical protein
VDDAIREGHSSNQERTAFINDYEAQCPLASYSGKMAAKELGPSNRPNLFIETRPSGSPPIQPMAGLLRNPKRRSPASNAAPYLREQNDAFNNQSVF